MWAMPSNAASYPIEEGNVVKQVRVGKGDDTEALAELWTLIFWESGIRSQSSYCQPRRASVGDVILREGSVV